MELTEHVSEVTVAPHSNGGIQHAEPAVPAHAEPPSPEPADSVGRIRDILFGGHMREYDRRFAQLEERILRASSDLQEEMSTRFSALEGHVRRELETLAGDLRNERADRAAAAGTLGRTLDDITATVHRLGEQTSHVHGALREQISCARSFLLDEDRRHRDELQSALKQHFGNLHEGKVDRMAMADLLSEVSARLKGALATHPPEGEKDGGLLA